MQENSLYLTLCVCLLNVCMPLSVTFNHLMNYSLHPTCYSCRLFWGWLNKQLVWGPLIMEATAPCIIIYHLECSYIFCLYSRPTLMFQHLVSEACQCSSITSALCLLFITRYVIALTSARTRTHVCKLPMCPIQCLSASVFFFLLRSISLLLLLWHTHTQRERLQTWGLAPQVFNTCFNVVFLKLLTLWKPQPDGTNLFSFLFFPFFEVDVCGWIGLGAPVCLYLSN